MSARLLIDTSAWSRLGGGRLTAGRAEEVARWLERGELGVCLPFLVEVGFSARSADDHCAVIGLLRELPRVAIDRDLEDRVIDAQGQLARAGHHRLSPPDLIIAALADRHGLGILHYDADYDVIHERTDLDFESVWLAPVGTL